MRGRLLLPILLMGACSQGSPVETAVDTTAKEGGAQAQVEQGVPTVDPAAIGSPVVVQKPPLHRVLQLTPNLYSGAQPKGAEAFQALAEMGIRTVVSVDGAAPDLASADAHGLRYIHVPIGYDGVDSTASAAFAKVMQEAEGPIYFHCHHGRQRGPAAAAIALRASTGCDAETGLQVLKSAGTSKDYPGLWRDVAAWSAARPDQEGPVLVEEAKVPSFTAGMAELDRTWDRIKAYHRADWTTDSGALPEGALEDASLLLVQLED